MKFTISVPDFQYAMRTVRDVVPSTGPLAETAGVLLEVKENTATFTAFNPQVMAKVTVAVKADRDGTAVIDAPAIHGAVSHFKPRNEVGVGTSDILVSSAPSAKKIQITAKTRYASGHETPHKRVFALRSHDFFPELPSTDDKSHINNSFELGASLLMDGIDSVAYALSSDKHQLLFSGVLFHLTAGRMTLFATNGICLAEYSVPITYNGNDVRVVIPGAFASKVAKSFFDTDHISVDITNSMMFIKTANLTLAGALIREDYPDYKDVLPTPKKFVSVDKHVLLDNLVNLSYDASKVDDSRVSAKVAGGKMELKCGSSNNEGIFTDFKGSLKFDCNLTLFANSIRNIYGEILKVGVTDALSPLQFSSAAEGSHSGAKLTCVLVPLSA